MSGHWREAFGERDLALTLLSLIFKMMVMKDIQILESIVSMPGMHLPVVSPLIHLSQANILISPGSQLTETQLSGQSTITDIVAPNLLHSAGIPQVHRLFPQANIWGTAKIQKIKEHIPWSQKLSTDSWNFQKELPCFEIKGIPAVEEYCFLHRESRTLILTDLCFNMLEGEGLGFWIFTHLFGTYKKFATSRLFTSAIKDKEAFIKSIREILDQDFENIIVSHGSPVIGNGKDLVKLALHERGYRF